MDLIPEKIAGLYQTHAYTDTDRCLAVSMGRTAIELMGA